MHKRSIVTKITVSVCGIVTLLLSLGGFALIKFETELVEGFTREHLEKITHSIDEREKAERVSLEKNIRFKIDILNKFGSLYIYHFEVDELRERLKFFMRSPEIQAIKVLESNGTPFAAAWKTPEITLGDALPPDLRLDDKLSLEVDSILRDQKIGSFQLYYTDSVLTEKIRQSRNAAMTEAKTFENDSTERLHRAILNQILGIIIILLALLTYLLFLLRFMVLRPISAISEVARKLADFDLTVNADTDRKDETGRLLSIINTMVLEFRKIVSDVKTGGKRLAASSEEMNRNINIVASAVEEMNINVRSVSETTTHMSKNVNAVASAIEEMSFSINKVGKNARQGSDIAGDAVKMAGKAGETMASLGEAASQIGEVTEVIKRIADKTTLLALNADIEAASAGEAGRGFAVVANEIKEFARQSNQAADDIANRISAMQGSTEQAVAAICDVSNIINSLNNASETITLALEEQMDAVNEIASNALQADAHANDIAASMAQLAQGANEVSMNVGIAARGEDGERKKGDIPYMGASSGEVARLANELLRLVEKFKVE